MKNEYVSCTAGACKHNYTRKQKEIPTTGIEWQYKQQIIETKI